MNRRARGIGIPTKMVNLDQVDIRHGNVEGCIEAAAIFSKCGTYRYLLTRRWSEGSTMAFIMLNPSTADENVLDPTLRRCRGYAEREGFGRMVIANLFALRSTDPKALRTHPDPVGEFNNTYLDVALTLASCVVVGWGNHGALRGRGEKIMKWLNGRGQIFHLGPLTGQGQPGHPLYLRKDIEFVKLEIEDG